MITASVRELYRDYSLHFCPCMMHRFDRDETEFAEGSKDSCRNLNTALPLSASVVCFFAKSSVDVFLRHGLLQILQPRLS